MTTYVILHIPDPKMLTKPWAILNSGHIEKKLIHVIGIILNSLQKSPGNELSE